MQRSEYSTVAHRRGQGPSLAELLVALVRAQCAANPRNAAFR